MSGDELILGTLNSSNQQIVSILIVNVYLLTNYGSDESTSAFRKTIAELEGFLLSLMNDHVIIAGDILLKSALISLSLSTSCKPLISLGVIHVLISHSHTDAMITRPFPGLMNCSTLSTSPPAQPSLATVAVLWRRRGAYAPPNRPASAMLCSLNLHGTAIDAFTMDM